MTDRSTAHVGHGAPVPSQRLREVYRIVAEVAQELARSEDAPEFKRHDLARASSQITRALREQPHDPYAWAEAAPAVTRQWGERVAIPEMLLLDGGEDPRRLARLLLRSLDWDLSG